MQPSPSFSCATEDARREQRPPACMKQGVLEVQLKSPVLQSAAAWASTAQKLVPQIRDLVVVPPTLTTFTSCVVPDVQIRCPRSFI